MASLHHQNGKRPGFKIRWREGRHQRALWLGDMSKRAADTMFRHISELIAARACGSRPATDTENWVRDKLTDERIRLALVKHALADPANPRTGTPEGRLLGPYLDAYVKGRVDVGQSTRDQYGYAAKMLKDRFGSDTPLSTITPADADRWRRKMLEDEYAIATVSKYVKRAKTMLDEAVNDRLIASNPFGHLKSGNEANEARRFNVDAAITADVLDACPDDVWRCIFGMARFAGMRPCEILTIKWSDLLWDKSRLRIDSPKTGLRFCPIFPELMPILRQAFDNAPEGQSRICQRYGTTYNAGTTMARIIEKAGREPWPKIFVNMRSTRRTELQRVCPDHVVNKWLGQSSAVAAKHYLQVTDDDWDAATNTRTVDIGGNAGGNTPAFTEAHGGTAESESTAIHGVCASAAPSVVTQATPQGLEP